MEVPGGPSDNCSPEDVKEWTAEDVARFIKTLGKGKVWQRYADLCIEIDIDGPTLAVATEAHLTELGFHKIHANKVLHELNERTIDHEERPTVHREESLPLPLTQKEEERMKLFGDLYELVDESKSKVHEALEKISSQKSQELSRLDKEFSKIREKVSRERGRCAEMVMSQHQSLQTDLEQAMKKIEDNVKEARKAEKKINKSMHITEWSEQKARVEQIMAVSQRILEKTLPILCAEPSLAVAYTDVFADTIREPFFYIEKVESEFKERSILVSEEERKRQEEAKKREEEEQRRVAEELKREEEEKERKRKAGLDSKEDYVAIKASRTSGGSTFDALPRSWLALTEPDSKRMECFFSHVSAVERCERKIKNAIQGLANQKQLELRCLDEEFKSLQARGDAEKKRLHDDLLKKNTELTSMLVKALEDVQVHLKKTQDVEGVLERENRITDRSQIEQRTIKVCEAVFRTIQQVIPVLTRPVKLNLQFSPAFSNALTEDLGSVQHETLFDNRCTNFSDLVHVTEGGLPALWEAFRGFEGLIPIAGGFEALCKGAGGFEALLKTLGGFEALCKGAGGFEALYKGAGGFEALLKMLGGFEAFLKHPGGFQAFSRGYTEPLLAELPDSSFGASSFYGSDYRPHHIKFTHQDGHGWEPKDGEQAGSHVQVDLGQPRTVVHVETKCGNSGRSETCEEFSVAVSSDGVTFVETDSYTSPKGEISTMISPPLHGRYVRFLPKRWNEYPCMKIELLGF